MPVWVKSTIAGRSLGRGVLELIAHGWAYLGRLVSWPEEIVNGVEEFAGRLNSFPARNACIKTLRVMSRCHKLGVGSDISVGRTEEVRSDGFAVPANCLSIPHATQTNKR